MESEFPLGAQIMALAAGGLLVVCVPLLILEISMIRCFQAFFFGHGLVLYSATRKLDHASWRVPGTRVTTKHGVFVFLGPNRLLFRGTFTADGRREKISTLAKGMVTLKGDLAETTVRVPLYMFLLPLSIALIWFVFVLFGTSVGVAAKGALLLPGALFIAFVTRQTARSEMRQVSALIGDLDSLIGKDVG